MRPRKTQRRKHRQRKTRQRGGGHFRFVDKLLFETVKPTFALRDLHRTGNAVVIPISAHGGIPPAGIPAEFALTDPRVSVLFYTPAGGVLYCTRASPTKVCTDGYPTNPAGSAIMPHDIYQGEPGQICPNYILTPDATGVALSAAGVASGKYAAAGHEYAFRSGAAICYPGGETVPIVDIEAYYHNPAAPMITLQSIIETAVAHIDSTYRLTRGVDTTRLSIQFHCLFCRS